MQRGTTNGHDVMVSVMREINVLSRSVFVLVANSTVKAPFSGAFADCMARPALGTTFRYLVDYSILVDTTVECIQSRIGGVGEWSHLAAGHPK